MAISDKTFQQTPEERRDIHRRAMRHQTAAEVGKDLIRLAVHARDFQTVADAARVAQQPTCPSCGSSSSYSVDDMTLACGSCGAQFPDPSEQQEAAAPPGTFPCPNCGGPARPESDAPSPGKFTKGYCGACQTIVWGDTTGGQEQEAAAPPTTRQDPAGPQGGYPVSGESIPGTGHPQVAMARIDTVAGKRHDDQDYVRCSKCARFGLQFWAHECGRNWYGSIRELEASFHWPLRSARPTGLPGAVPGEVHPSVGQQVQHDDMGTGKILSVGADGGLFVEWSSGARTSVTPSEIDLGVVKIGLTEGHPDRAFASVSMRQVAQQPTGPSLMGVPTEDTTYGETSCRTCGQQIPAGKFRSSNGDCESCYLQNRPDWIKERYPQASRKRSQQNPMEPPAPDPTAPPTQQGQPPTQPQPQGPPGANGAPPGVGGPGGPSPAGPPQPKRNPARTKEMWDPEGGFAREVEADSVDDLVRLHNELSQHGLAPQEAAPQPQQPTVPPAQYTAQKACEHCQEIQCAYKDVCRCRCHAGEGDRWNRESQEWSAPSTAPIPMTAQKSLQKYENLPGAISVKYSPVNQAYFVMWNDQVLNVLNTTGEVDMVLRDLGITVGTDRDAQGDTECPQCASPQPIWSPGAQQCAGCGFVDMGGDAARKKTPPGAPGKDQQIDLAIGTEGPGPGGGSPAGPPGGGAAASRTAETGPCRKCGGPTRAGWCETCRMNWMMQDQIDQMRPEDEESWRRITDSKAAQLSSPVAPDNRQDEQELFEDTKEAAVRDAFWLDIAASLERRANGSDDYKKHVKKKLDEAGLAHPFEHDDPAAFLKEVADEWHGKKKDGTRTAQPLGMPPAAAGMTFEHDNERSDGDRVLWDISWEPEMVAMMSSADIEQNLRSYVLRAVSDEKTIGNDRGTRNWGTIADPRVEDIDVEAGIATISFQTSEQAAPQVAPATVTE